jgi:hypothetical protein
VRSPSAGPAAGAEHPNPRSTWKTRRGRGAEPALWQRLAAAMSARRVTWPEVKGREIEELALFLSAAFPDWRQDRN